MIKTILNYLSYASTWNALVAFAAAAGLHISPDQAGAIVTAAVAAIGAIELFIKDSSMEIKAKAVDATKAGV